jgi:hypothetical protein
MAFGRAFAVMADNIFVRHVVELWKALVDKGFVDPLEGVGAGERLGRQLGAGMSGRVGDNEPTCASLSERTRDTSTRRTTIWRALPFRKTARTGIDRRNRSLPLEGARNDDCYFFFFFFFLLLDGSRNIFFLLHRIILLLLLLLLLLPLLPDLEVTWQPLWCRSVAISSTSMGALAIPLVEVLPIRSVLLHTGQRPLCQLDLKTVYHEER